jgi:arsenite methyltransferase
VSALGLTAAIICAYALFMGGLMIYESRIQKPHERERILDLIEWRGDEYVLDVGCGRGLMLIGAALRLNTGKAVGIDIWSGRDQADNSAVAPVENARLEGVANRVRVETADMRDMPFADNTFDVVLSSWVVHNVELAAERQKALAEMVRVLKPSGTLALTDIENRAEYLSALAALTNRKPDLIVFSRARDLFRRTVSFGSFGPATILLRP